jgi:hypothetical protein
MDRLINVFIGGSSEGLKFADYVKENLENTGGIHCTIWNKETFQFNETFLFSLSKASLIHDFGIFIASKDDIALIRDNLKDIPRDNVLFEYGLFHGALGNNRTFLIQEKDCKLPTDLLGNTTPQFERNYSKEQWEELALSVSDNIKIQFQKSEIQLLPSTSLAIGYFNSFLSRVTEYIFDNDGCELIKADLFYKNVTIKVILPNELSSDISEKAQKFYKNGKYEVDEIGDPKRPFPIRYYKQETKEEVIIVDMPTTHNAIRPAVNLLVPDTGLGINPDKLRLERKELENFFRTLAFLISQDDYAKDIVKIEWME